MLCACRSLHRDDRVSTIGLEVTPTLCVSPTNPNTCDARFYSEGNLGSFQIKWFIFKPRPWMTTEGYNVVHYTELKKEHKSGVKIGESRPFLYLSF